MEVVSGVHTVLLSCVRGIEVNSFKKKKRKEVLRTKLILIKQRK